jgi:hypothetical protein
MGEANNEHEKTKMAITSNRPATREGDTVRRAKATGDARAKESAPNRRPHFRGDEDAILRGAERVVGDPTMVRVECLHRTQKVLRKAGFLNPRPFYRYLVRIEEKGGRLCVAR